MIICLSITLLGYKNTENCRECFSLKENENANFSEFIEDNNSSLSPIVYGRLTCNFTNKMMKQLAKNKIPYKFKDISNNTNRMEMKTALSNADISGRIPLPVVSIKDKIMLRPKISEVIEEHQNLNNQ